MDTHPPPHQARRIRTACALLLFATGIHLITFVAWKAGPHLTGYSIGPRSSIAWIEYLFTAAYWLIAISIAAAAWMIYRTRIFPARRQGVALVCIAVYTLLNRGCAQFYMWWLTKQVGNFSTGTSSTAPYTQRLIELPLWIFILGYQLLALSVLFLLLSPAPKLVGWKNSFQLQYRIVGLFFLATFWATNSRYLLFLVFRDSVMLHPSANSQSIVGSLFHFLGNPFMTYTLQASIIAASVFLVVVYRRANQLTFDPNCCTNCAYPLDQSMTTCPECGVTRAAPLPNP